MIKAPQIIYTYYIHIIYILFTYYIHIIYILVTYIFIYMAVSFFDVPPF